MQDSVFREFMFQKIADTDKTKRIVFTCQNFLTALMTLTVSQYPWHMKLTKAKNIVILDTLDPK